MIKPLETKRDRVAKLARRLAQTDRLRHIWLADAPPHYPSVYAARRVEQLLKEQIQKARQKRLEAKVLVLPDPSPIQNVPKTIKKLLERTPPPPAVIACTLRPTYFLPQNSPLRRAVKDGGVLSQLRLRFPRLPEGLTEQSRWDVVTSPKTKKTTALAGDPYDHVYEAEVQTPIDGRMPPFCGPGRLMLWYVADLQQQSSLNYRRPEGGDDLGIWADALAQTTINLLDAEFGIKAWADPTYTGLWVRKRDANGDESPEERQIAAIWPHIDEASIVTAGITLNVGLPREEQISTEEEGGSGEQEEAKDEPDATTSIAAELASRPAGFNPKHRLKSDAVRLGKTMPVREIGAPASAHTVGGPIWYTRAREEEVGAETVAPLGMDNFSISVAWSHELTRVLGYRNALVDHQRDGGWTTRKVMSAGDTGVSSSSSSRRLPMRPRILATKEHDDASEGRNKEEERITFNLGDIDEPTAHRSLDDAGAPPKRIANFQRTMFRLAANLKQSVGGNRLDTRNSEDYKEKIRES